MLRLLALVVALASPAAISSAQDHHSALVGSLDTTSGDNQSDVWGAGDTAFVGRFFENRVDIVDVSNPASPVLLSSWLVPSPNEGASAQDVKVANGLMFVALEFNEPHGVEIVDVRDPANPAHLTWIDTEPGAFEEIHNVFYWEGWLFMDNSADNTVSIVDLRAYDPDAPPANIGTWTYRLDGVGGQFVHDVTVADGVLYCAAWDSLWVYDVSNLSSGPPVFLTSVPGVSCHSVWPTADGAFVVVAEEREAGGLRLYEVVGAGAGLELVQRDSFVEPLNSAYCVHNPVVLGDRVYSSYYQAGAIVLEIDRVTKTLVEVARYDTNSLGGTQGQFSGFAGSWGIYPLGGESRTLVSDFVTGLSVVDFSALAFGFPDGRPVDLVPGVATPVTVRLDELDTTGDGFGVRLAVSVDGRPFVAWAMDDAGGGSYTASIPPVNRGSEVRWYVSATDGVGRTFQHPLTAPGESHRALAHDLRTVVFEDDFESDLGWSVTSAPTGTWVRTTPTASYSQPAGGAPGGLGTQAFVTGNLGSNAATDDVDGGTTTLTSPAFSLANADGRVSYERWFFNDDADPADELRVEIASGAGPWTAVSSVSLKQGGWVRESFVVSDFVTPSGNLRVRFHASDDPNNSITDAALDSFRVERFDVAPGLVFSIDPVFEGAGTRWRTTGAGAGELVIVGSSLAGTGPPLCLFGGAFCLDLAWPIQIVATTPADAAGADEFVVVAPPGAAGVTVSGQAVVLRGAGFGDTLVSNPATITIR